MAAGLNPMRSWFSHCGPMKNPDIAWAVAKLPLTLFCCPAKCLCPLSKNLSYEFHSASQHCRLVRRVVGLLAIC